jgi:hypothetical protein
MKSFSMHVRRPAFSAVKAFAADVTGAWSGEAKGPNGESFQLTLTFKQYGTRLTGTVTGGRSTTCEFVLSPFS